VIPLDLMLPNLSYCSPAGSHKLCETKSFPLYADSERPQSGALHAIHSNDLPNLLNTDLFD
jgi:hypothetical protein